MRILAVDGSPSGGGRTETAMRRVLAGAGGGDVVSLADGVELATAAAATADAFVFGSPVYRATYAWPLKAFFEQLPRGKWGEETAPLRGKAVAIVATGASLHHFLSLDAMRNMLAGFFATHVVPPGLYVPREGFDDAGGLVPEYEDAALRQGEALAELARALESSPVLRTLEPQA